MSIPLPSNDSIEGVSEDDGVHGLLGMVHCANLRHVTREELESLIADWRSIHGLPPEVVSRGQVIQHIGPKLTHLDLRDIDLSKMDLRCIKLLHCNLSGVKFNGARLDGAFLFGCDLSQIDSWVASFRCTSFRQCYIVNSRFMHGQFEGASFAYSNLENTKLINSYHDCDTWFFQTRLYRTNLQESHLEQVDLKEARTLFGVKLYRARLEGTELDYRLFGGKIGEELEREFVQAAQAYSAIKANLEAAGQYNQAARAYVKERQMRKNASAPWNARRLYGASEIGDEYEYSQEHNMLVRTKLGAKWWNPRTWWFYLRHSTRWVADWIVELLCSYGESVWRVLFWMVATLLVIGPVLISLLGGLEWNDDSRQIYWGLPTPLQRWAYAYFQYVLYMIDTFTTAEFAQLEPVNDPVRLVSGLLAMLGVFLAGLLGFVAGNRIRYS